jgi:hypothetical protein
MYVEMEGIFWLYIDFWKEEVGGDVARSEGFCYVTPFCQYGITHLNFEEWKILSLVRHCVLRSHAVKFIYSTTYSIC